MVKNVYAKSAVHNQSSIRTMILIRTMPNIVMNPGGYAAGYLER